MKIRFAVTFAFVALLFFVALFLMRSANALRTGRHSIGKLPIERGEPLRIRSVKVKEKKVKRDEGFLGDDDWFRTLTVTVRNATSKKILFASIDLVFPPASSGDPITVDEIDYGERSLLVRPATAEEAQSGIAPDEEVNIPLSAMDYERIRALLTAAGYTQTPRLNLKIGRVIFADDSSWYGGTFQRDPADPTGWINTEIAARATHTAIPRTAFAAITEVEPSEATRNSRLALDRVDDLVARPEIKLLFAPTSYRAAQQSSGCYRKSWTGYISCSVGAQCQTKRELSDTSAGGYQFQNAQSMCQDVLEGYCGMGITTIAIPCSFSGGGGGGGGGEEGGCATSWECFAGEDCCAGACQQHTVFGCLDQ